MKFTFQIYILHSKENINKRHQNVRKHLQIIYLISKRIYKEFTQHNSKKKKIPIKKWAELTFFQRRHINSYQVHEKVLNIINPQGNVNQKI